MRLSYLVQRGNQYYFQLRLPADVQPYFCCTTTLKDTWYDLKALLRHGVENEKYKVPRNFTADKEFELKKREKDKPLKRAVLMSR